MVFEVVKFIGFYVYFWVLRLFGATLKSKKLRNRKLNVLEAFATADSDDWCRESLGRKNDRLILNGSTAAGDFILVNINFGRGSQATGRILLRAKNETFASAELQGEVIHSEDGLGKILVMGPLRLELRDPFKRWRVTIRGTLSDNSGNQHFVRLFSWLSAASDESYFLADLTPYQLASIATVDFPAASELLSRMDFIQWGTLRSKIIIDDGEPYFVDFRTLRMKTLSSKSQNHKIIVNEVFSSVFDMGDRLFTAKLGFPESSRIAKIGELFQSDHMRFKVFNFDSKYSHFDTGKKEHYLEPCQAPDYSYSTWPEVTFSAKKAKFDRNDTEGWALRLQSIQDLRMSISFSTSGEPSDVPYTHRFEEYKASEAEKEFLILPFTHRACQDSNISGGKGSNLARLMGLQATFTVPIGFVVTVKAFEKHLQANPTISNLIETLSDRFKTKEDISKIESEISQAFLATSVSTELDQALASNLSRVFGPPTSSQLFAVRSSAVGEDGTELSSAGQLETYLNISRVEVRQKIIECWASNYRREILTYRSQNAQNIHASVAVVVQAMVDASSAGVMFTNDPVKGDPSKIVINVVEGLGEALVSGQKTPEQVILNRDLKVVSKSKNCSLDDKISAEIAHLGMVFEDAFGGPQDVEFAIQNDHVFVLQTRSITNLDLEIDWEFEHEFDTPTLCERDLHTTANVGEVLPRPLTPLGDSLLADLYDRGISDMIIRSNQNKFPLYRRIRTSFPTYRQRVFLNLSELYLPNWPSIEKDRTSEYSVGGQKMFTEKDLELGKLRFGRDHERSNAHSMFTMLKTMFYNSKIVTKEVEKSIKQIKKLIEKNPDDIDDQIELIEQIMKEFFKVLYAHQMISMFSSFTYILVAMFIRGSAEGDLSPEVLSDIAVIYGKNPLKPISADVPKALKHLAKTIIDNDHLGDFEKLQDEPKKVVEFLLGLNDSTGTEMARFLKLHGHRGVSELLLQGVPWKDDPSQIVANLKSIIKHQDFDYQEVEEELNLDDLIDQLKCVQVQGFKRKIFKFFINEAYRGVYLREQIKSEVVYATGILRDQCLNLGKLLQLEGLLYEPRTILFATWNEILELIQLRSSRILHRIRRREKIFDHQVEQEYPFISEGTPIPKTSNRFENLQSDIELSGTPVCEGMVTGKARVAKTLDDAFETKPGEILITRYTDIGWSPIFPIIRGLVTEIGGLLSHGSVVAREYGLPCIIAVENATDVFHTGDEVLLDSAKGVIKRIPVVTET